MSLSQNQIIKSLMEFANAFEVLLGKNGVFSNSLICEMIEISKQDFQVILFAKLDKRRMVFS